MFLDCGRKSENPENMQTPHGNRWIAPVQQSERNSFSEERECLVVQISWQSIKIAGVSRSAGGKKLGSPQTAGNIWIHLGDMNICTSLHGNPSNKLWNQSGGPPDRHRHDCNRSDTVWNFPLRFSHWWRYSSQENGWDHLHSWPEPQSFKKKKKEKAGTGEGTIALYEKPAVKSQAGALSFQAFPHFLWINNSLAGRKRIHLR